MKPMLSEILKDFDATVAQLEEEIGKQCQLLQQMLRRSLQK
jgi:hypothetical protein